MEGARGEGGDWCCSEGVRVIGCQRLGDPWSGDQAAGLGWVWKWQETGSRRVGQREGGTGWKAVRGGKRGVKSWRGKGEVGVLGRREKGVPVHQPP